MKTLIVTLLLLSGIVYGQKDSPYETSSLNPANNKAIFSSDTTNVAVWQFTLKNDTASRVDSLKFYEIIQGGDTVILRFTNAQTGVQDTMVVKSGKAQDYVLTKPIVGKVMAKLLSITTIDILARKRKYY